MANSRNEKNGPRKKRRGSKTRTSNQGLKLSSGERPETNNHERSRYESPQSNQERRGSSGKIY